MEPPPQGVRTSRTGPAPRVLLVSTALLLTAAGSLLAMGCSGAGRRPAFATRDSAGIAIAVSERAAWKPGQAWRVVAKPLVDIGGGSDPHQQLFRVRDATRLPDGDIVVANAGTNEIRIYDAAGHWVRSLGRTGDGPGEFRALTSVYTAGDSILALDGGQSRLSVFDTTGALRRDLELHHVNFAYGYEIGGMTPGGLLLVFAPTSPGPPLTRKAGVYRDSTPNVLLDAGGAVIDTVGRFGGDDEFLLRTGQMLSINELPFGDHTSTAVLDGRLYEGDGDRWQVSVYDDGGLSRILRWDHDTGPVTDAALDSFRSWRASEVPPARRAADRKFWQRAPHADRRPAYTRIVVDSAGDVWLRDFRTVPPADRWHVFTADGRLLGAVTLPRSVRVTRVGSDWLLGVWRDGDGVEHVQLLRVVKP